MPPRPLIRLSRSPSNLSKRTPLDNLARGAAKKSRPTALHSQCLARPRTRSANHTPPRGQAKAKGARAPKAVMAKGVEDRRAVPRHAWPPEPCQAPRKG